MTGKRLVALALLAAACASTPPTPPPNSLPAPARAASRVVLMSFDGLGADAVASYPLPALKRLPLQARVIPVEPTATAPTHAAILTGAQPHRNGILSNLFHRRGTPPREAARGMDSEIETETLLDAARRSGKRVGSIAFPTVDGTSPRRRADFGISWTKPLTAARIFTLTSDDFRREWLPTGWTAPPRKRNSFSPIR
ncbi:MAG TPA: alkaline phosphatase family protein, partial [Thermoanaerobaculia bacterium]|nr:alkaline phosphatase family protein [Thermoanaerobaculia bacterium]